MMKGVAMPEQYRAVVITVSDRCAAGERKDAAGPAVAALLRENGYEVGDIDVVPDGVDSVAGALIGAADSADDIALIVTTGGTGFAPRDLTPEATEQVCQRMCPGIGEAMRAASATITDRAWLSRATAGIRGRALIVNLPGSPKAAVENLEAVIGPVGHGLKMLRQGPQDCAALKPNEL